MVSPWTTLQFTDILRASLEIVVNLGYRTRESLLVVGTIVKTSEDLQVKSGRVVSPSCRIREFFATLWTFMKL
jgi:hypothetical protein